MATRSFSSSIVSFCTVIMLWPCCVSGQTFTTSMNTARSLPTLAFGPCGEQGAGTSLGDAIGVAMPVSDELLLVGGNRQVGYRLFGADMLRNLLYLHVAPGSRARWACTSSACWEATWDGDDCRWARLVGRSTER